MQVICNTNKWTTLKGKTEGAPEYGDIDIVYAIFTTEYGTAYRLGRFTNIAFMADAFVSVEIDPADEMRQIIETSF